MATNEKRLNVSEFDFDDVKDNLKVFLKTHPEYTVNWPVHTNPHILKQIKESFPRT